MTVEANGCFGSYFSFKKMRTKKCVKNLKIADSKHPQSKTTVIHALVIHFFAHFGSVMCGEFLV